MRSTKTPLLGLLRQAYRLAVASRLPDSPPTDELLDQWAESRKPKPQNRREFLRASGQLALLAGGVHLLNACQSDLDLVPAKPGSRNRGARFVNQPSVAIIGAGIAGLSAAHHLYAAGFTNFTIYESSSRTGGRIFSAYDIMGPGLVTELGGEFIDSTHEDMLYLCNEFGLPLLDMQSPSELALKKYAFLFNGQPRSMAEVVDAFRHIAPAIEASANALPNNIDYNTTDSFTRMLDRLSISQYLSNIGATGWLKELLEVVYETEYGRSCDDQSALNFITLISPDTSNGELNLFGSSDKRYKVAGGNQRITNRMTEEYQEYMETGRALRAMSLRGSQYELIFDGSKPILADYVILTIPFSVLSNVSLNLNLPAIKKKAIQQLGYGTNAKLVMGFSGRSWRDQGYTGFSFSDNGLQAGWDNSQLQPGPAGGYTVFAGGSTGNNLGSGTPAYLASRYLPRLDQLFPGASAQYNGRVERMHWPSYRHSLGSYSCYRVGQWTGIGGAEFEPAGRVYFAGEHCSRDAHGYMNGAAETGRRAAQLLLQTIPIY
ncbi:NAD(P)-binding protein [Spirosoma taeanense]|uniref:Tryptophan 2-monooxygenase n=1 Tax=Spirosoma taeanense TaxID=2735870 RepID=A0A6M5Y8Q0_9BACT|nr:NAD(P)/FAD-dependent oxidoreductase [Spirosoma taeanense]QJW90647.1 NAD(P)-binding protein [Spirosoma taeanense]